MPPSRGRILVCQCVRCLRLDPAGRGIPSRDRRQHCRRDLERELAASASSGSTGSSGASVPAQSSNPRPSTAAATASSVSGHASHIGHASPDRDENRAGDPSLSDEDEDVGSAVRSHSDDVPWLRPFMVLLLWLSCARGLSNTCATLLLVFVNTFFLRAATFTCPKNIITVQKQLGHQSALVKYAICPNDTCQSCWVAVLAPATCTECGTEVFQGERGKPFRYFHYGSVVSFLQDAFQDPEFEQLVNHWRTRPHRTTLSDVYDGTAWNADGFLDNRLHLRLSLGIDWFTPHSFSNTASYSIGAISIRIENLPPSLRNRAEYLHVAMILPGPRQTGESGLNSALKPLIDDLRRLSQGVPIQTEGTQLTRTIRAKLFMALGDTPARAKIGGFPSHAQGGQWCGHCKADSATWVECLMRQEVPPPRDPDSHRTAAFVVRAAPEARDEIIRSSAATWTALYDLPYWRSVTDVPVDAMHALHLGACKRYWHSTLVDGHLLPSQMPIISAVISSATYPRTLTSIRSNFGTKSGGSPTSDAWSTFARFLMPLVLASHWSELLAIDGSQLFTMTHRSFRPAGLASNAPTPPFERSVKVRHLVQMAVDLSWMVHLVQRTEWNAAHIAQLDRLVRDHIFNIGTYIDPRWLVPNHHALTHLPDHIRRFGPPREFWFYSMERLNGFLKKTQTNEHHGGELEATMQRNHAIYRTVQRQIRGLGQSGPERTFQALMEKLNYSHDPFQPGTTQGYLGNTAALSGKGEPSILPRHIVDAIVTRINTTRTDADPVAVADTSRAGQAAQPEGLGRMTIFPMATEFPGIAIDSIMITPTRARANVAQGASNVLIITNAAARPGKLLSAFQHTYANPISGQLVKMEYAEVLLHRTIPWPHQHVLQRHAVHCGYSLYSEHEGEVVVVPRGRQEFRYKSGIPNTLL